MNLLFSKFETYLLDEEHEFNCLEEAGELEQSIIEAQVIYPPGFFTSL